MADFIRTEQNGIEYFTIVATGVSGMSQRGLARACGKADTTIQDLVNTLQCKSPSKWLKPFVGKALDLQCEMTKNGKIIKPYRSDFCAAVVKHYAYKGVEIAQDFDSALGAIGLESYIQGVTKWLPKSHQSSLEQRTALSIILDEPTDYRVLYDPVLYDKAVGFVGVGFYWKYCYDFLTLAERCKLNRVNEITPEGRVHYIHQHINPETRQKLELYLIRLEVVVRASENKQDFQHKYQHEFYRNKQLRLDLEQG